MANLGDGGVLGQHAAHQLRVAHHGLHQGEFMTCCIISGLAPMPPSPCRRSISQSSAPACWSPEHLNE